VPAITRASPTTPTVDARNRQANRTLRPVLRARRRADRV